MEKFSLWLDKNRGMATRLARTIQVNRTSVSNCKNGILLMPTRWMPHVVELSGGQLDYQALITEREHMREALERVRRTHK